MGMKKYFDKDNSAAMSLIWVLSLTRNKRNHDMIVNHISILLCVFIIFVMSIKGIEHRHTV